MSYLSERFVILGKSFVKLNELREIYVSKLAETEFSNPNYGSKNLKVNLEKTYGTNHMVICPDVISFKRVVITEKE
jgi:hypothetical protein